MTFQQAFHRQAAKTVKNTTQRAYKENQPQRNGPEHRMSNKSNGSQINSTLAPKQFPFHHTVLFLIKNKPFTLQGVKAENAIGPILTVEWHHP